MYDRLILLLILAGIGIGGSIFRKYPISKRSLVDNEIGWLIYVVWAIGIVSLALISIFIIFLINNYHWYRN